MSVSSLVSVVLGASGDAGEGVLVVGGLGRVFGEDLEVEGLGWIEVVLGGDSEVALERVVLSVVLVEVVAEAFPVFAMVG